jgi:hypothetical protein
MPAWIVSKGLEQENGEPADVVAAWPVNITLENWWWKTTRSDGRWR